MKLQKLALKNFRSIEDLVLEFPSYYTAVSGKNNSGKSNLLEALKSLFERETQFPFRSGESLNHSDDFPIWKAKDDSSSIVVSLVLQIDRTRDSSVFKLATDFFNLSEEIYEITLELTAEYTKNKDQPDLSVRYAQEVLDSYKSRTMLKTISSAGAFQFHNSTEMETPFSRRTSFVDLIGEIAKTDKDEIAKHRDKLSMAVANVAKKHQREFSELLGRLEDKYTVALTTPKLNVDYLPIDIMLGDKNPGVSLEEWGSGTQNRTHILMTLFRAKKLSESLDEDVKIAPIFSY